MQGGSGSSRGMRNTKQQCRIIHCTHRVAYRLYNIVHILQGARHPIYLGVIRIMTNYMLGVQYMYWGRCRLLCSIRIARGRDRKGTHMWRIYISTMKYRLIISWYWYMGGSISHIWRILIIILSVQIDLKCQLRVDCCTNAHILNNLMFQHSQSSL